MSYIIKIVRLLDKYIFGFLAVIIGLFSKLNCKKSSGIIREAAFIKLWAIGDSVTTLPLIKKFKEVNKKAKITLIVTKRNIDVYKEQKFIDKIILLDINKIFEIVHLFKKYDLVFDLEPYLNISALLSWFIGKHRIGFSKQIRSIVYNERIPFSKDKHIVNIYLQMIESFSKSNVTSKLVKLELTNNEKKIVNDFLLTNKITTKDLIIGVCPGAAESVKERMWPT